MALAVGTGATLGCEPDPGPESLLTLVKLHGEDLGAAHPGETVAATVRTTVTFRDWHNAALVVEFRSSTTLDAGALESLTAGDAVDRAVAWQTVMAASQSLARAVEPVTGYPTLVFPHAAELSAQVPAALDGVPVRGVFAVAYLAFVDEEQTGEEPLLVVTPLGEAEGVLNTTASMLPDA